MALAVCLAQSCQQQFGSGAQQADT